MSAKRQANGDYLYRGQCIQLNDKTPPGKLGRYSVEGIPFAQLNNAREYIDVLCCKNLQTLDECI